MATKWTKELVEERLKPALKELGTSAKKVAESLKAKKIKGYRSEGDSCPIAVLVKKTFKSAEYITVDGESIDVCVGGSDYFIKPPAAVRKFIERFDAGDYPELDYEPVEEEEEALV